MYHQSYTYSGPVGVHGHIHSFGLLNASSLFRSCGARRWYPYSLTSKYTIDDGVTTVSPITVPSWLPRENIKWMPCERLQTLKGSIDNLDASPSFQNCLLNIVNRGIVFPIQGTKELSVNKSSWRKCLCKVGCKRMMKSEGKSQFRAIETLTRAFNSKGVWRRTVSCPVDPD